MQKNIRQKTTESTKDWQQQSAGRVRVISSVNYYYYGMAGVLLTRTPARSLFGL